MKSKTKLIPKNNSNGITLIALIITIIVLLILAGITIRAITGENGLLKEVSGAADASNIATAKEDLLMAWNSCSFEYKVGTLTREQAYTIDRLNQNLTTSGKVVGLEYDEGTKVYTVNFEYKNKVYVFEFDMDGNIKYVQTGDSETEEKNEITVTFNPESNSTISNSQEVGISINSKLSITSSEVIASWSKENKETEGTLPSDFDANKENISVTHEGNVLTGTSYKEGVSETGNYYLYLRATINGETVIEKAGPYSLQKSPTVDDITITPVETTETSVSLKITEEEEFSGYTLQCKVGSDGSWTNIDNGHIEIVTQNTTIYARLYKSSTEQIEKSFIVDTITCLHETMTSTGKYYHECTNCDYEESHNFVDGVCTVCSYTCGHNWTDGVCDYCQIICTHELTYDSYEESAGHYCEICGISDEHNFIYTDSYYHTCKDCGLTLGHSLSGEGCIWCGFICEHTEWTTLSIAYGSAYHTYHACSLCNTTSSHTFSSPTVYYGSQCDSCSYICSHKYTDTYEGEVPFWENGKCTNCGAECTEHEWTTDSTSEDYYTKHICEYCGTKAEHDWSEGSCYTCNMRCEHYTWTDGQCDICGMTCYHSYDQSAADGICTMCGMYCSHGIWSDGYCTICGKACEHCWIGRSLFILSKNMRT